MHVQPARKFERGQVLPILVLALLGLAGFAALALDGGNLYTEQRRAQAAADNAVMAAALQQMNGITSTVNLQNAAFANATQNGYTAGPNTKVVFHWPPVHGAYTGNRSYMEVVITQTVPTALAHLIYQQDPIPVTVIAVAHGLSSGPLMDGYAIAAMYPNCDSPSTIYLNADGGGRSGGVFLTDGGAFVNAGCDNALDAAGNHDGIVTNGPPISVVGTVYDGSTCTQDQVSDPGSNCNFYPGPTTGVAQVPQDPLAGTPASVLPSCSTLPSYGDVKTAFPGSTINALPGQYTSLDSGQKDLNLAPGIYCLSGGTLSSGNGKTTGIGVMIYLVDKPANIDYSGNKTAILDLEAPTTATSGCTGYNDTSKDICKYLGIVVYKVVGYDTCQESDKEIDFTGQGSMNVVGLIYAPHSLVRYGGSSYASLTMTGQTIAGCVKYMGNGNINIIYNPNDTYSPPPSVRLDQ